MTKKNFIYFKLLVKETIQSYKKIHKMANIQKMNKRKTNHLISASGSPTSMSHSRMASPGATTVVSCSGSSSIGDVPTALKKCAFTKTENFF